MWKDAVLFLASFTGSAVVQQDIQNHKNMLYIRFFYGIYICFFYILVPNLDIGKCSIPEHIKKAYNQFISYKNKSSGSRFL